MLEGRVLAGFTSVACDLIWGLDGTCSDELGITPREGITHCIIIASVSVHASEKGLLVPAIPLTALGVFLELLGGLPLCGRSCVVSLVEDFKPPAPMYVRIDK